MSKRESAIKAVSLESATGTAAGAVRSCQVAVVSGEMSFSPESLLEKCDSGLNFRRLRNRHSLAVGRLCSLPKRSFCHSIGSSARHTGGLGRAYASIIRRRDIDRYDPTGRSEGRTGLGTVFCELSEDDFRVVSKLESFFCGLRRCNAGIAAGRAGQGAYFPAPGLWQFSCMVKGHRVALSM